MRLESILYEANTIKPPLAQETRTWLQLWTEKAPRELPSRMIIEELKAFRPTHPIPLWRYVQTPETEKHKKLLSWLPNVEKVIDAFYEGPAIYIKFAEVEPDNILVDMRLVVAAYPEMDNVVLRDEVITYQL